MAEIHTNMDRASQQIRKHFAEVMEPFLRELDKLEKPEERLRLEKEAIESEQSLAREELHRVAGNSAAALDAAADRMLDCRDRLRDLHWSTDKASERQRAYDRQVLDLKDRFPRYYLSVPRPVRALQAQPPPPPPTPQPDPDPTPGGSDTPRPTDLIQNDSEEGTRISAPPTSSRLVTLQVPKRGARKRPLSRSRSTESEGDSLPEETVSDDDGEFTDDGGTPDTTGPEPRNKRKMSDASSASSTPRSKRARVDDTVAMAPDGDHSEPQEAYFVATEVPQVPEVPDHNPEVSEVHSEGSELQTQPFQPPRRTIEFNELYQDGKAKYKHYIEWYGDKQYILLCDEHNRHFGRWPIKGAAGHLESWNHGRQKRSHSVAIQTFGIEVLNCDIVNERENNASFKRAIRYEGYVPLGAPRPPGQKPSAAANASLRDRRESNESVPNPTPGDIYHAFWPAAVAVIVLPRDCFGDPSFADVGLRGSLADSLLLENVPKCYRVCPETGAITGWEDGYEDGGSLVGEREFPVMYFNGDTHPRFPGARWMPAGKLTALDLDDLPNLRLLYNFTELQRFRGRRRKLGIDGGRDASVRLGESSEDMELQGPPLPGLSTSFIPTATRSPNTARSGASESTVDGPRPQRPLDSGPFGYGPDLPPFETGPSLDKAQIPDIPARPSGATTDRLMISRLMEPAPRDHPEEGVNDTGSGVPPPPTPDPLVETASVALDWDQCQSAAREWRSDKPPRVHRQTSASMGAMGPTETLLRRKAEAPFHTAIPRKDSMDSQLPGDTRDVAVKTQEPPPPPGMPAVAEISDGMPVQGHQYRGIGSLGSPIDLVGEEGPRGPALSPIPSTDPVGQGYEDYDQGYRESLIQVQTFTAALAPLRPQHHPAPDSGQRTQHNPSTRLVVPKGPGKAGGAPVAEMSMTDDWL